MNTGQILRECKEIAGVLSSHLGGELLRLITLLERELLINTTLAERGERYGDFAEMSRITQNIKRAMRDAPNWETLSDDKRESLEMVAHKIGRILNGDPEYHDSWHDIVGYAKRVADRIKGDEA